MGAAGAVNPTYGTESAPYQANKGYFDVVFEALGSPAALAVTWFAAIINKLTFSQDLF